MTTNGDGAHQLKDSGSGIQQDRATWRAVLREGFAHTCLVRNAVGIAGPIASGKSTLIANVAAFLQEARVPHDVSAEQAHPDALGMYIHSMQRDTASLAGLFQMLMGSGAWYRELYAHAQCTTRNVAAFIERPYTENKGFALVNALCDKLTPEALAMVQCIPRTPNDQQRCAVVACLYAPMDVCHARRFRRGNAAERDYRDRYLATLDDALYFRSVLTRMMRGHEGQRWLVVPSGAHYADAALVVRACDSALRNHALAPRVSFRRAGARAPTILAYGAQSDTAQLVDAVLDAMSAGDDDGAGLVGLCTGDVFARVWRPETGTFDTGAYAVNVLGDAAQLSWDYYERQLAAQDGADEAECARAAHRADAFKYLVYCLLCLGLNVEFAVADWRAYICDECDARPVCTGISVPPTAWAHAHRLKCHACFYQSVLSSKTH